MYMPVHFVWNIETLQAYISIQYYARSAPFCQILSHIMANKTTSDFDLRMKIRSVHDYQCAGHRYHVAL
jgi:hypothetical protein